MAAAPRTPYKSLRISIARPFGAGFSAKTIDGLLPGSRSGAVLNEKYPSPQCQKSVRGVDLVPGSYPPLEPPEGEGKYTLSTSLRATGSRECAPDDRLREAIHRAARKLDCFVAFARRNDERPRPRGVNRPSCASIFRPKRAWGMPGANAPAASRAKCKKAHERSHHRFTGKTRHPRTAMVLTGYLVLSPATGLVCHRRLARLIAKLDASVGASGPHAFAVRFSAVRQWHIGVHRIPLPTFVTIASAPFGVGRDGGASASDLGDMDSEIFFSEGLDRILVICPTERSH